ncbi:MAG: hypothetical protein JWM85_1097 [Acidimicrobiaceae bacterium]|nr:hypothetical protein [Acidimicrobiaceae bacterium]
MCSAAMGGEHSHVVDVRSRSMMCTCRPCYLLFTNADAALAYRSVPDRYLRCDAVAISPGQWDDLAIPVGIAFFFTHSSRQQVVAFYPGPAGATESELPLKAWEDIVEANPVLLAAEQDVEAILLRRRGDDITCYLVPIDACYELVGRLRQQWRGFDGGQQAKRELEAFFESVEARAQPA